MGFLILRQRPSGLQSMGISLWIFSQFGGMYQVELPESAILGAWIGGLTPSATLSVLFLGIGAGAILEVVYEIAGLIRRDTARESMPLLVFGGVTAGMLLLWVTGLLIK